MNELLQKILEQLTAMSRAVDQWPMHLRHQENAPNDVQSSKAYGSYEMLKATGCRVYDIMAGNNGSDTIYLMVFDSATLPRSGSPLLPPLPIPPGSVGSLPHLGGLPLVRGLTCVASSSPTTLTYSTSNDAWFLATLRV